MSTFANQLKAEIARISKKEARSESVQLKKSSTQYRSDIAALKRRLAALESMVGKLHKQAHKEAKTVEPAESGGLRFRVGGFASLRKRLGLTANQMGILLGVSGQSVYNRHARPAAYSSPKGLRRAPEEGSVAAGRQYARLAGGGFLGL